MSKEKNPMYGRRHSDYTKKLIGERSKQRWKTPEFIKKQKDNRPVYDEDNPHKLKGILKVERITVKCETCYNYFEKIITSKKRFCSPKCHGHIGTREGKKKRAENISKGINKSKQKYFSLFIMIKIFLKKIEMKFINY